MTNNKTPLLDIKNLKIMFSGSGGLIKAVEGIDIKVNQGESIAIVGESGCGKSVTALSIMKLLNSPPALYTADTMQYTSRSGEVLDLISASEKEMQSIRGNEITMIYQDPSSALNPVLTVGEQLDEVFIYHKKLKPKEAKLASIQAMKTVGIPAPAERYKSFPHELSGGMKQRILIAMATACSPKLMIADEPTTALDVTIQAQVLDLIASLQYENNMATIFITHDLGVVKRVADRVYVMYCGKIVEEGTTAEIFSNPKHPYTAGLLSSIPTLTSSEKRFTQIKGNVPHPSNKPSGCYFSDRCDRVKKGLCDKHMPPLGKEVNGRRVRCWVTGGDY